MSERDNTQTLARWRLVLGKYASRQMPCELNVSQQRMAEALEKLYSREYSKRGVRQGRDLGPGSLDPSQLNVPQWLDEIRELFPEETYQRITQHALERYGMTELLNNPETLENLEPSTELLASVLMLKGNMSQSMLAAVRKLVRRVVEQIQCRLKHAIQRRITGQRHRFQQSHFRSAANFDAHKTIRRNLKYYDPERKKLIVQRPYFFGRVHRHLPWEIILCVDQSGSMAGSLIHSAVLAGAIAELPAMRVRLVVFDTSVVDLSEHVTDPVEVLISVQLGGGTNIGKAMNYCRTLVRDPRRTIVVLVTDFCEGADPRVLRQCVRGMKSDGCHLIGLASLEESGGAWFDEQMAARLAADGMQIAAVTPNRLAEWLAEVMQSRS
ncbi:MAG: VWA domain-containing protein [Planctomycetaceae bacterium]|nr:VWA domain-containing protein [Planctomycetaceae bacterium]MCB9949980.1 VWA domain-containing protein [Planctomycetaceae bacterium]